MFKNLTGKQKIFAGILLFICLTCIILAIYFGVSCNNPQLKAKPSFKSFSTTSDNPWLVPTWYKYSYVDKITNNEGVLSDSNTDGVQSNESTNPIIQVTLNKLYNIQIYRAIGTVDSTFNKLTVTVATDGTFTDTANPSPPKPLTPTYDPLNRWSDTDHSNPWFYTTFYKYSYSDTTYNVEGNKSEQLQCYKDVDKYKDPIINFTKKLNYTINIYRSIGKVDDTQDDFVKITNTVIDANGNFTDTDNPSPPRPSGCVFKTFNEKSTTQPWSLKTWYVSSYSDKKLNTDGPLSDIQTFVVSSTDTNPSIQLTLNTNYNLHIFRALEDPFDKGNPGPFLLIDNPSIDKSGIFTDYDNPSPTLIPKPQNAPVFQNWT